MISPLRLDPRAGLVRGGRAAILTVPAVGIAGLAHVSVDGCASAAGLLLAAGVCWPGAVALLGARRRLPTLLLWLLAAQVVSHLLLEQTCHAVTSGQMSLMQHLLVGLSPAMVLSHLGAAMVTTVLLGSADHQLWAADALLRAARRALPAFVPLRCPALPGPTPPLISTIPNLPRVQTACDVAPLRRRGPPALLAF